MKIKKYKKLFEVRRESFKAWFNPSTGESRIFDKYGEHRDYLDSDVKDNKQQLQKGWYRIGVASADDDNIGEVDIESLNKPSKKELKLTQEFLKKNYYHAKTNGVYWEVLSKRIAVLWNTTKFYFLNNFENFDTVY